MALLSRRLKTFGVLVGGVLTYGFMGAWSQRLSLIYFAVPASVVLAVAYSMRVHARAVTAAFFVLAIACAVGPVDLEFRSTADPGIHVLRVSYGRRCVPDTLCKGCVVPRNPLRYAVVVSLPR